MFANVAGWLWIAQLSTMFFPVLFFLCINVL